jgi:hypothetical protein
MSRILCTWEMGSGLGHLNHLRLPIEQAVQLGHEVYLAARSPGDRSFCEERLWRLGAPSRLV